MGKLAAAIVTVTPFQQNCTILWDDESKEGVVIDPGGEVERIKAALDDSSRAVYYGLTRVGLGARNADANQENRALLLSKKARADSDPVLEILTNDVIRVAHGATAGPVDEEQLYYLESRGIPRTAAEDLLVRAFLGQVLDRVPDDGLREQLETIVEAKLAGSVS